jgi:heat shock protein HslJ
VSHEQRRYGLLLARVSALSLTLLGFACLPTDATAGDLENIQWKLTKYSVGGVLRELPTAANIYAEFKEGRVSGKAVNAYSGSYKVDGNGSLTIGDLSTTLMTGPPESQAVENAYYAALRKTASYTAAGSTLILHDAEGADVLVFSRIKIALVGSWKVTAYSNGKQAVVSAIATSARTMSFAADGTVAGDAGVNRYDARYTTSGIDGIEIGPVATTKKAGPAERMEQERDFLTALSASKVYQFGGETLELRSTSGALQVSAERAD